MTQGVQSLAHARGALREKKKIRPDKKNKSKSTSQSIKMYQKLEIRPTTNAESMLEVTLSREVLGGLIAVRPRHSHFADYCKIFWAQRSRGSLQFRPKIVMTSPFFMSACKIA